ncbi:DNA-binding response regulator [Shewanella piezotolerans WP3]|uniref:DNA-binding response regulator n=1 Tax=Shewanella piezotolerans (strain WP3 / JCM 13877) TaxID=225849 RepID=B8CSP5_SHEPW|nr:response regulator transcription factor [Shewanella piezotolerans]ACJ30671.1 DNA-binding response regulator [Shewanella piezotolerans WP3]
MSKAKILIIEDDKEISRLTAMYLEAEGYSTHIIADGAKAKTTVHHEQPDFIILDLMLPGLDGVSVCKQLRQFYQHPILVLTACSDDISEVSLLKLGADDYLTKPVRPHVLLARIENLLRRYQFTAQDSKQLQVGQLKIDTNKQQVSCNGLIPALTTAEYEMLLLLATHAGKIVSREDCCRALRGINYDFNDRSVDMRISGLRKKLNDDALPYQTILTIRNKGYMLSNG